MQSSVIVRENLENKKQQHREAVLRETILNELRQSVQDNMFLAQDLKAALLLEIVQLSLDTYLEEKLTIDNPSGLDVEEIQVEHYTPAPANVVAKIDSPLEAPKDLVQVETHCKTSARRENKKLVLNLEEKRPREQPSKEREAFKNRTSQREQSSPRNIISVTKSLDSLQDNSKTQNSPQRRNSGSPRWFLSGSESSESPRKKRSLTNPNSGRKGSPRTPNFFDLLPIDRETLQNYLGSAKPYLKVKDSNILVLTDEDRPEFHLVVIPHREMKTNTEIPTKALILVDRKKIEGEGANKVVTGYDLINKNLLAIKILNQNVTESVREMEIRNLIKRGWFYGCYRFNNLEFSLIMKLIPGETLLQTLYVTDDTVSKHDVSANYCPQKKDLDFNLQLKIILNLMKEVLKLHQKYKQLHRDLKPENIKIYYEKGELKVRIIDFGDAVPVESKIKGLCGTDGYTDPEIFSLDNQKPYQKGHDYFSLGVIIAEILTQNNYQKAIRDHRALVAHEIITPRISPTQIQLVMDDVFKPETIPDQYDSIADHQTNIRHFMLLELKKLAKKMLITRLQDSSLHDEIHRIETIEKDCRKFSKKMEHFCDVKEEVQAALNKMNNKFNAGFFLPQKEFQINSAKDATECFKEMHSSLAADDFSLYI